MQTGLSYFDELVDLEGKSVLISGCVGVGKTSLLVSLVCELAIRNHTVLWMSSFRGHAGSLQRCITYLSQAQATNTASENTEGVLRRIILSSEMHSPNAWPEVWAGKNIEAVIFDDVDESFVPLLDKIPRARTVIATCRVVPYGNQNPSYSMVSTRRLCEKFDSVVHLATSFPNMSRLSLVKSRTGLPGVNRDFYHNHGNPQSFAPITPIVPISDQTMLASVDQTVSLFIEDLIEGMDLPEYVNSQDLSREI